MDDWRIRLILGAVAALVVGAFVWNLIQGEDEPTLAEKTQSAEFACRHFVEEQVDPLDVDFRDPGSSDAEYAGETFTVRDRAAVSGDLVNYECTTTRQDDGDWTLDDLSVR